MRWEEFGDETWPPRKQRFDEPDWPDCYCGRYMGKHHHYKRQCGCYEVFCRWWVEREPPSEGKPAGPKWTEEWGYDIPRKNLMGKLLPRNDESGGSFHATTSGRHLDQVLAERRKNNKGTTAVESAAISTADVAIADAGAFTPAQEVKAGICAST